MNPIVDVYFDNNYKHYWLGQGECVMTSYKKDTLEPEGVIIKYSKGALNGCTVKQNLHECTVNIRTGTKLNRVQINCHKTKVINMLVSLIYNFHFWLLEWKYEGYKTTWQYEFEKEKLFYKIFKTQPKWKNL